ncbi:unnamed protein product [Paramecium sonneborni]|uniref:Uncharacterized protein n=1 Tax=Paramecium sonneborni TaxID=65129 RepID=A0A8S1PHU0_9CILI|nr:unnamed protein product [Paramecium sonneborni]
MKFFLHRKLQEQLQLIQEDKFQIYYLISFFLEFIHFQVDQQCSSDS